MALTSLMKGCTMNMPKTLPLLLNDPRPAAVAAVAEILRSEDLDPVDVMIRLVKFWKIKIFFSEPVRLAIVRHWVDNGDGSKSYHTSKTTQVHIIPRIFKNAAGIVGYGTNSRANKGYELEVSKIVSFEPVASIKRNDHFASYEEFKARFDLQFISEAKIQDLWAKPSAQTGEQYTRADFRPLSPTGRQALEYFLRGFKGLDGPSYSTGRHKSKKRDITISFDEGRELVHYSSEYPGCGNGSYGILANKSCWLHLEDD